MVDFNTLKKNSGKNSFEKLSAEIQKLSNNENRTEDDRFWKPTVDKAGNGQAVIRFLPAPKGEDIPYVRYWDHGFQGPGGWYIENSLTSFGMPDPVSEYNSKLWATGNESDKDIARTQKRRLHYISNIYVISDSGNKDNEGKVFLFTYGKKIFDKLNEAMHPEFEDETPLNPFDLWEGANFKLKIRNVEGYRNYDRSEFSDSSSLHDDDDELKQIWEKEHSLTEFLDPKNFKSYDELKEKLTRVLTGNSSKKSEESEKEIAAPVSKEKKQREIPEISDDTDDEDMKFFKDLAKD